MHIQDMEIWEMVGLWHYPIPGFFLLAQFCLGILVALGNLVNNSVFLCLSDEHAESSNENSTVEGNFITVVSGGLLCSMCFPNICKICSLLFVSQCCVSRVCGVVHISL